MKTLYEILEVSENASKEIIEKAYKVLAKRYHPDLQEEQNKEDAEKKMKEINEAYSILSNDAKRKEYNEKLKTERQKENASKEQHEQNNVHYQQNSVNYNNTYYKQKNENYNNTYYQAKSEEYNRNKEYEYEKKRQEEIREREKIKQDLQAQYEQKYQDAYENYLRSLGYKIKYKWTWKNYKQLLITIMVIIAVCTFLWFFPPTNKMLMDFYNSNQIFKTIVDAVIGIINGIWRALCSAFSSSF